MTKRRAYGTARPTKAQEKRRGITVNLPLDIARAVKEEAERAELTPSQWLGVTVERALDAGTLDKRTTGLLREVRVWLRPPKDATPQAKAGLRATRLVIEGRIRAFRGCLPALEWTRLATMAQEAQRRAQGEVETASATSGATDAPKGPSGVWERMVDEARGYNRRANAEGDSKTDPADQGAAPDDSAGDDSVEPAADEPFAPRLVLPDTDDDTPGYKTVEERLLELIAAITEELKQPMPPRLPKDDRGFLAREDERAVFRQQQRDLQAERARLHEELLRVQGRLEKRVRESDPNAGCVINHRPGRPESEDDAPVGGRSWWSVEPEPRSRGGWLNE